MFLSLCIFSDIFSWGLPASSSNAHEIKYVKRQGGIVLLRAGYQMTVMRHNKNGTTVWRCTKYATMRCQGSIMILDDKILKETCHICVPNFTKNDLAIKMDECIRRVKTTDEPISKIYSETLAEYENCGTKYKNIKSTLYRARKAVRRRYTGWQCRSPSPEDYL